MCGTAIILMCGFIKLDGGEKMKPGPKKWGENRSYAIYYIREGVKCGKPACKCTRGELHGPYWYSYQWSAASRRLIKKYIGKQQPADIDTSHQVTATMPGEEGQHILEGVYPSLNNPE
jgi:hypothetical protein